MVMKQQQVWTKTSCQNSSQSSVLTTEVLS